MRDNQTPPRPPMIVALALLGLPAAAEPGAPATLSAEQDAPGLEAVLDAARAAAKREAWRELGHGLRLTGETDTGGVDAGFELFLTSDGRYRYDMDGPLARRLTFDGREAALRVRRGPTQRLELGDLEGWHLAQWVHSGYWLEAACPLRIELAEESDEALTLRLTFPDSPASARLVLDRETSLPRELVRPSIGGESVLRFEQYEPVAGVPVARHVRSSAHGEETVLRVLEAQPAAVDAGARYARSKAPPEDVRFDAEVSPKVELKRVRSGHLLVHPLVDGADVGWFILDTGAGQVCIDPQVADGLGLEEFGSTPAVGVAGSISASYRQGKALQLGPMLLEDPVYVEIDLAFLAPHFGVDVAGICGYEVFARAVVDLDLEEVTLALHDPASFELDEEAWTPLVLDRRVPSLRCRFEGEREGLFKIDLGDSGTISFYSPAVEALRLLEGREVREAQVGGVGGMGKASRGDLEWFEVGGHRVEPLPATFSQTDSGAFASVYALGNLGNRMLKPFRIVFDYSRSRIALLPRE